MSAPVALITGVSRAGRVGHAIARRLWGEGFDLVLTHRGAPGAAERIAADLRGARAGGTIRLEALDLEDLSGVGAAAARLGRDLARLDALVHNASLYEATPLAGVSVEQLERFHRVNALGPLLLSRGLSARLGESPLAGGGSIVAMGDLHAMGELGRPRREHVAYEMSKAALHEAVLVLARELAPRVRVNMVAPGVVAFPQEGPEADPQRRARYLARVPLGRSGTPEEAAAAVAWLITGATYCTGQTIRVDGGRGIA